MTHLLALILATAPVFDGRLTGDYAAWGPSHVEAYSSRDLTAAPLARAPVDLNSGAFQLVLPSGADTPASLVLALLPDGGAPYPWLLTSSPVSTTSDVLLPVVAPPSRREERQSGSRLGLWIALALAALFAAAAVALRGGPSGVAPPRPPLWPGLLTALPATAVLAWGLWILDEPFDLLEHTYFQEAYAASTPWGVATAPVVAERAHAPGYAVLLWCVALLGHEEWLFRLPALLAQLVASVFVYRVVVEATGRRSLGVAAALAGSLLPLALRYGRDATPYALHALFAVVTTWLLHRALVHGHRRSWALYGGVSVLSFLTHYFAIFLTAGQVLAALVLSLRRGAEGPGGSQLRPLFRTCFAMAAALALWAPEIARQFVMSADDNQVTQVVYPLSPGFGAYVVEHLRVLLGVPGEAPWLLAPLSAVFVVGAFVGARRYPTVAALVGVPLLLVLALLGLSYGLHVEKFAGRVYFGWRWLRGFVPAVGVFLALGVLGVLAGRGRIVWRALTAPLVLAALGLSAAGAAQRVRPAQDIACERLLASAENGDALYVLPAPFYTVGLAYVLQGRSPKYIHPGPSIWSYFGEGRASKRVFGPVRSFGLPVESLARHHGVRRLWVAAFEERLFGRAEFDESLTQGALDHLDRHHRRLQRIRLPFMTLSLYEAVKSDPWREGTIVVDTARLWESLSLLPEALDPDALVRMFHGEKPIDLRIPRPTGARTLHVSVSAPPGCVARVSAVPRTDHPGEARLQPPPPAIEILPDGWRVRLSEAGPSTDTFELRLERAPPAAVRLTLRAAGAQAGQE